MKYSKTTLTNGLTVVTAPLAGTQAVTVQVMLPVGSRYETKDVNGVSHFIEHLLFKGTAKRPTSIDITKELDAVGAQFNAFTSKEYTGYYIKVAAEKIELAFDILSDMIFNSVFDAKEIDKERGVIVEEINMYNDNPLMSLDNLFEETMFPNHELGWLISGPAKVIKTISREKILDYKQRHYRPEAMVLSVAGNASNVLVNKLAKKYFGVSSKKTKKSNYSRFSVSQQTPQVAVQYKDTAQVQMGLGFPAYALGDKRNFALGQLGIILGGNMSSRLFSVVREEHGLAYYIRCDASPYQDIGVFMVQAGLDRNRVDQAITLILQELKKVADNGVTKQELQDAKEFTRGSMVLAMEDSEFISDWFAKQQMLHKKVETPLERLNYVMKVTPAQVQRAAQDVFKQSRLNLALIGPFKDVKPFKKLLKF